MRHHKKSNHHAHEILSLKHNMMPILIHKMIGILNTITEQCKVNFQSQESHFFEN